MSTKRSRAAYESSSNTQGPPHHASYALYGTPLPAYDPDARDDGSYVPVWKQEVTDERGRKRLHGAFTGGFSAGYFNSVGSKEGWTPSAFVSSRSNRAKVGGQRAEDFMDDEDLAEREEAQQLETQHAFAGLGGAGAGAGEGKGMFSDLFRTTGETMGAKLLQRMGWREGQGIGPKVRRRAQGDVTGEAYLFAPENTRMVSFAKKSDRKGLGFAGEEKLGGDVAASTQHGDADDDSDPDARILRAKRSKAHAKPKPLKKSGFGVGVLNDTGSDDEDPYAMGPRISYSRIIGGDKKKKKGGLVASTASPNVVKPGPVAKTPNPRLPTLAGFRRCHDGRLPLDGFSISLSSLSLTPEANPHPPPEIPPGWTSSLQPTSTFTSTTTAPYQSPLDAAKPSKLDPTSRAALLGEQPLRGKSIFDYITPADRARLAALTGRTDLPPGKGESAPPAFALTEAAKQRAAWDTIPKLDPETARVALLRAAGGWMPYSEDEGKQGRYRAFLEISAAAAGAVPACPVGPGRQAWAQELREFGDAAEIFRPVSGSMAARFTTSSSAPKLASDAPDAAAGERRVGGGSKEETPAEKAAKLGMYGPLTRSRAQFFPTRLLCKRFNVKAPAEIGADSSRGPSGGAAEGSAAAAGSGSAGSDTRRLELVSQADVDRMMRDADLGSGSGGRFVAGAVEGGKTEAGGVEMGGRAKQTGVVDVEQNEALEGKRAGEAVFKAIFGSEDEDDE